MYDQINFTVKIEGQNIPFTTSSSKQTVASLIHELEERFRKDHLTQLTISKLKVGNSSLLNKDKLVEVLNDGDIVVANVGGK